MHFQILFCLFASSLASPLLQLYGLPNPGRRGGFITSSSSGFRNEHSGNFNGGSIHTTSGGGSTSPCGDEQVRHFDGSCREAEISRNIFIFKAPEQHSGRQNIPSHEHKPKLNYNIVFVRTPEGPEGHEPVVVPPPQQKTLVYVLNKHEEDTGPQVIEMPDAQAHAPEVFYINYREGENLQLPIGVDLQTALASARAEQGQQIGGIGGGSIGFSGDFRSSSAGGFGGGISGGSNIVGSSGSEGFLSGNGGFGGSVSGGSSNVGTGGFVSGSGGFGDTVSGGSISIGTGGIGNFRGAVSEGNIEVIRGETLDVVSGSAGFISDRGISREYTPPNPSNLYRVPLRK